MFGRLTRTRFPAVTNRPVNKKQSAVAQNRRTRRQQTARQSYNRRARDQVPLQTGQPVYYQHLEGQRWRKGTVQSQKDEFSYIIEGDTVTGGVYQRKRVHITPTCIRNVPERRDQTSDQQQSPEEPEGVWKSVDITPAASLPVSEKPSSALDTPTRAQRTRRKPKRIERLQH